MDHSFPVGPADFQVPSREGSTKNNLLRVLADINESTYADNPVVETADVDIANRINLGK